MENLPACALESTILWKNNQFKCHRNENLPINFLSLPAEALTEGLAPNFLAPEHGPNDGVTENFLSIFKSLEVRNLICD